MTNFDDIDLGIFAIGSIIVVGLLVAMFVKLPPEVWAFGSTGIAAIAGLARGIKKKPNTNIDEILADVHTVEKLEDKWKHHNT